MSAIAYLFVGALLLSGILYGIAAIRYYKDTGEFLEVIMYDSDGD